MIVDVGDRVLDDAARDSLRVFVVATDKKFGQHVDNVIVKQCLLYREMFPETEIDLMEIPLKPVGVFQTDDRSGTAHDRLIKCTCHRTVKVDPFTFPGRRASVGMGMITIEKYDLAGKCPEYLIIQLNDAFPALDVHEKKIVERSAAETVIIAVGKISDDQRIKK